MTPTDILVAARAKIAQGWTRRAFGRDKDGYAVNACDPDACAWCVMGALRVVIMGVTGPTGGAMEAARRRLERAAQCPDIMSWNDDYAKDQSEVLAAFDRAIKISKRAA